MKNYFYKEQDYETISRNQPQIIYRNNVFFNNY